MNETHEKGRIGWNKECTPVGVKCIPICMVKRTFEFQPPQCRGGHDQVTNDLIIFTNNRLYCVTCMNFLLQYYSNTTPLPFWTVRWQANLSSWYVFHPGCTYKVICSERCYLMSCVAVVWTQHKVGKCDHTENHLSILNNSEFNNKTCATSLVCWLYPKYGAGSIATRMFCNSRGN